MAENLTPENVSAIINGVVAKLSEAPPESLIRSLRERSGERTEETAAGGPDGPTDAERKLY